MSHTMKLWERIIEARLREITNIADNQFGFRPGAKTIKKNTNSTQNKSETHHAKQYEVTSFLSTDCELSTETCSKNVYSLGPRQIDYRTDICIENATGEIQREKQRAPHGFRRP